jgi:hypothetical protein
MANQNDEKILQLGKLIEEKKKKLKEGGKKKFVPITNCSLEIDGGTRYNLNASGKEQLTLLLVKLNMYKLSVENLGLLNDFTISQYKVEDWMTDIKSRLEVLSVQEEESKLRQLEQKLDQLLSEDKRVELEINSIEELLK